MTCTLTWMNSLSTKIDCSSQKSKEDLLTLSSLNASGSRYDDGSSSKGALVGICYKWHPKHGPHLQALSWVQAFRQGRAAVAAWGDNLPISVHPHGFGRGQWKLLPHLSRSILPNTHFRTRKDSLSNLAHRKFVWELFCAFHHLFGWLTTVQRKW